MDNFESLDDDFLLSLIENSLKLNDVENNKIY